MASPHISLLDLIEREELQKIQDAFAEVHDVASVITDVQGNSITEPSNFSKVCQLVRKTSEGASRCIRSDRVLGIRPRGCFNQHISAASAAVLSMPALLSLLRGSILPTGRYLRMLLELERIAFESMPLR